jgi:hypothetical protein
MFTREAAKTADAAGIPSAPSNPHSASMTHEWITMFLPIPLRNQLEDIIGARLRSSS